MVLDVGDRWQQTGKLQGNPKMFRARESSSLYTCMLHSSTVIQNKQALTLGSGWCIGDCSVTTWAKRCRTGAVETWRKVVSQRVHSHYRCHHAESQNCDKKDSQKKGKKWGGTACNMYIKAKRRMCSITKNYEHSTCLKYIKTGRTCVFFIHVTFVYPGSPTET